MREHTAMPMRVSQYAAAIAAAAALIASTAAADTCTMCDESWDGGPGDGCYTCDDTECGSPTCPDDCGECPDGREYMCKTFSVSHAHSPRTRGRRQLLVAAAAPRLGQPPPPLSLLCDREVAALPISQLTVGLCLVDLRAELGVCVRRQPDRHDGGHVLDRRGVPDGVDHGREHAVPDPPGRRL